MPFVLYDVRIGFDNHTELQIFAFIHLYQKTLLGQFGGELGQKPDVGFICPKETMDITCAEFTLAKEGFTYTLVPQGFKSQSGRK